MKTTTPASKAFATAVPAVLWQILFFYFPLLLIVVASVIKFSLEGEFQGFTFEKITYFFTPSYLKVLGSSIGLGLSNALLCMLVGFPIAYALAFNIRKYRNFFLFLLMIPFWTNFLLHVYAWFYLLEKQGIFNTVLMHLGLMQNPHSHLNNLFAIMIMMLYYYLPFFVLPLYSSLERFDKKLIEASLVLGASWPRTLHKILLPIVKGGLRAGFFLVLIPSFGEFAIPELMGGDKIMFSGSVISHYILGDQTGSLGAAFALVSCVILFAISLLLYKLFDLCLPDRIGYESDR